MEFSIFNVNVKIKKRGIRVTIIFCMYVYVSMYVCMYVSMYVCMDGWMKGWMNFCMYGWMDGCMCVRKRRGIGINAGGVENS